MTAHFRSRARRILLRCDELLLGLPVCAKLPPAARDTASSSEPNADAVAGQERARYADKAGSSEGFRLLLGKLAPKLRSTFERALGAAL